MKWFQNPNTNDGTHFKMPTMCQILYTSTLPNLHKNHTGNYCPPCEFTEEETKGKRGFCQWSHRGSCSGSLDCGVCSCYPNTIWLSEHIRYSSGQVSGLEMISPFCLLRLKESWNTAKRALNKRHRCKFCCSWWFFYLTIDLWVEITHKYFF